MKSNAEVVAMQTAQGVDFSVFSPQEKPTAPTLLLLAMDGASTLRTDPYDRVGRLLYKQGWNVASLDLPCHGADCRAGEPLELVGWAARIQANEDIVSSFQARVNAVVAHLVAAGISDPTRIAVAGTSRGGFMAFQAAMGNRHIGAIAAFAPVTDLRALSEFAGQRENPLAKRLALIEAADQLADRSVWCIIGSADERVDTRKAVAFAAALKASGAKAEHRFKLVETPGHSALPEWHDEAAAWLLQVV
jgi:dienelactone hydrolase